MTDSGQTPETPPDSPKTGVPPWAPTPPGPAAESVPHTAVNLPASGAPAGPSPAPYVSDVAATMRLIPVPPPSTPPPPIPARIAIPPPQVFAVMHGVLQALDYAHKHAIVHRDMKPENVLLSEDGMVKVADFGIARLTDDTGVGGTATKTGTTVGTPQYMSPEQVASSKVDGRSDLYSAGIMFYELVAGEAPFTANESDGPFTLMAKHVQGPPRRPSIHRPVLDMGLEESILKSISKRPEDRYQTGQEFDDAISRIADRLFPGWQRSLEPGADLSKMVRGATPQPLVMPAAPIGIAIQRPATAVPPHPVYNPAPPVKPVVKQSAGCMGVLLAAMSVVAGRLRRAKRFPRP